MPLAAARARVAEVRAAGGEPLVRALVEQAELEPIFSHRQAVVRGLLGEAAALLDTLQLPALEGRVLLRLAHVKLSEQDLEGAEQLVARAISRLDNAEIVVEANALLARSSIRRKQFAQAEQALAQLSAHDSIDPDQLAARRAAAQVAIAFVELALEQTHWDEARERLDILEAAVERDEDLLEQRYVTQQMRAAVALSTQSWDIACNALRATLALAKAIDAAEEEVETRIALAGALVERGDSIGLDEAEKHLQNSRDRALESHLDALYTAALIGQAGVLNKKGKTKAALDRCIEIAEQAAKNADLNSYQLAVALMSQIYEQKGDLASAYRTYAEAHATLRDIIGDRAKDLFLPHIRALAERIGPDKFREIASQVNQAAQARKTFLS